MVKFIPITKVPEKRTIDSKLSKHVPSSKTKTENNHKTKKKMIYDKLETTFQNIFVTVTTTIIIPIFA